MKKMERESPLFIIKKKRKKKSNYLKKKIKELKSTYPSEKVRFSKKTFKEYKTVVKPIISPEGFVKHHILNKIVKQC